VVTGLEAEADTLDGLLAQLKSRRTKLQAKIVEARQEQREKRQKADAWRSAAEVRASQLTEAS
jgi:hypothetical protein